MFLRVGDSNRNYTYRSTESQAEEYNYVRVNDLTQPFVERFLFLATAIDCKHGLLFYFTRNIEVSVADCLLHNYNDGKYLHIFSNLFI